MGLRAPFQLLVGRYTSRASDSFQRVQSSRRSTVDNKMRSGASPTRVQNTQSVSSLGDGVDLAGAVGQDANHLVDEQGAGAGVERQHRDVPGPGLVGLHQAGQQPLELLFLLARGCFPSAEVGHSGGLS